MTFHWLPNRHRCVWTCVIGVPFHMFEVVSSLIADCLWVCVYMCVHVYCVSMYECQSVHVQYEYVCVCVCIATTVGRNNVTMSCKAFQIANLPCIHHSTTGLLFCPFTNLGQCGHWKAKACKTLPDSQIDSDICLGICILGAGWKYVGNLCF